MFNLLVPSRGPSNLRLSNLQSGEVKVQWEPLSQQYANGQLLGYSIYVYEYDYYANHIKTVHSNSASVHMVIVRGLKAAQRYRISVAAFTSKGVGPQSYYAYITTGNLLVSLSRYTDIYNVPKYDLVSFEATIYKKVRVREGHETYIVKTSNKHEDIPFKPSWFYSYSKKIYSQASLERPDSPNSRL